MAITARLFHATICACALLAIGCSPKKPVDVLTAPEPTLAPGDAAYLLFLEGDDLSGLYTLDSDGVLSLPSIGRIASAGRTASQLEADIVHLAEQAGVTAGEVRVTLIPNDVMVEVEAEQQAPAVDPWLQERILKARLDVEAKETALKSYRAQTDLTSMGPITAQMDELSSLATRARLDLGDAEARLAAIEAANQAGEVDIPGIASELRNRHADAVRHRDELKALYQPDPRQLSAAEMVVEELERQVASERQRVLESQRTEVLAARTRLSALETAHSEAEGQLAHYDHALSRLKELEREAMTARDAYETLLEQSKTNGDASSPQN